MSVTAFYRSRPWTLSRAISLLIMLPTVATAIVVTCYSFLRIALGSQADVDGASPAISLVSILLCTVAAWTPSRTPAAAIRRRWRVLRLASIAAGTGVAVDAFGDALGNPTAVSLAGVVGTVGLLATASVWLYWRRSFAPEVAATDLQEALGTQPASGWSRLSSGITLRRVAVIVGLIVCIGILLPAIETVHNARDTRFRMVPLSSLPGMSPSLASDLKALFPGVSDPVLFDNKNNTASVTLQNYPAAGDLLGFDADIETLQQVVSEGKYIEARGYFARGGDVAEGMATGVVGLVSGLWALIRHPIRSAQSAITAAGSAIETASTSSPAELAVIIQEMADAFYTARCIEKADAHGIAYGMTILPSTDDCLQGEVNGELTGEATFELAMLVAPMLTVGKAKQVVAASKAAGMSGDVARLSQAGRLPAGAANFAKHAGGFSKATAILERNLAKLPARTKPYVGRLPVASVGRASGLVYREIFFTRNPALRGKVVVHHAVEQQVATLYPNLFSPEELNSLENLRGLPNALDDTLHKSQIRREWNEFYRLHPASTTTRAQVLQNATEIDCRFGHLFDPPLF